MGPLVTTLLPTAVSLLQELGKTNFGKDLLHAKEKIIEVAVPAVQKASNIAINFLSSNIDFESSNNSKTIQLSKKLDIVENGLSLPLSYQENQFKLIKEKITDDLDVIKGQNEILFLSNSINYFIESHKSRTGIDRGVSYALQYDISAVCNFLKKRKEIRFPGYLLHQFTSLGETIKELNIFYASILHEGYIPEFNEQEIKDEYLKGFGVEKRKADIGGMYIPYDIKIKIIREKSSHESSNSSSLWNRVAKEIQDEIVGSSINEIAHDALFILKEELIANEELEHNISKKLKILPNKKIIIKTSG